MKLDLDEEEEEDDEDGFNMDALLEALPAVGGIFNLGEILESLTETEGVQVPPDRPERSPGALHGATGRRLTPPPPR